MLMRLLVYYSEPCFNLVKVFVSKLQRTKTISFILLLLRQIPTVLQHGKITNKKFLIFFDQKKILCMCLRNIFLVIGICLINDLSFVYSLFCPAIWMAQNQCYLSHLSIVITISTKALIIFLQNTEMYYVLKLPHYPVLDTLFQLLLIHQLNIYQQLSYTLFDIQMCIF